MKVWISCDMEGVAGVSDWSQCLPTGAGYALGCELMLAEVNAAIDGALAGGADEIVVNDSHGGMINLDPSALHGRAAYLAGRHKPLYMMQGLDASDRCDLPDRLPRVDLRRAVGDVPHLQPRGLLRGQGQRHVGR